MLITAFRFSEMHVSFDIIYNNYGQHSVRSHRTTALVCALFPVYTCIHLQTWASLCIFYV